MTAREELERVELNAEQANARRKRSLAIALGLGGLVALFYGATVVKLMMGASQQVSQSAPADTSKSE